MRYPLTVFALVFASSPLGARSWHGLPVSAVCLAGEPRYEGFGAVTQGAESHPEGSATYHVTTLADEGPGTLRDALTRGGRHIVFDLGGTLRLTQPLTISQSYLTIDGESAPSPGVTIEVPDGTAFTIEGRPKIGPVHDVIVRHLRFNGIASSSSSPPQGKHKTRMTFLSMDGGDREVSKIVIDHIAGHHSMASICAMSRNVHDVTISWCLITDSISVTGFTGIPNQPRGNLSVHHNVWANNSERMPRVRHCVNLLDMVNNVIYQWDVGEHGNGATTIVPDAGEPPSNVNVINNYYYAGIGNPARAIVYGSVPGPSDDGGPPQQVAQGTVWSSGKMGDLYVAGNVIPPQNYDHWSTRSKPLEIPEKARVTVYPAESLGETVVPHVGTHYPTEEEKRLCATIRQAIGKKPSGGPTQPESLKK